MASSTFSRLDTLPQRPPTPPRDVSTAVEDAISFLDDSNEIENCLRTSARSKRHASETPSQPSPASSQEAPASSNTAKRVGFTPAPTYHQISNRDLGSSPTAHFRRRVPSMRNAKPLRSILKQSDALLPLTPDDLEAKVGYFSPQEPGSFAKMLQSVVHQLQGPLVSARLDAYMALNNVLKAYDGVPETKAMIAKMDLLAQCMTRDMVWKSASGSLDTNIINQALKLAAVIICDPQLSAALDDDFRTFLLERCITVAEQADMPKTLIKSHMFLLAQQRFQASVLTSARTNRIVTALQTIEDRCSGSNAIATRLVIYRKLLYQAPAVMLSRMRDWLEHVFHGALSNGNDIRTHAVDLCTQAGLTLGVQYQATKAVLDLFETEVEENKSYCDYLGHRLMQMIAEKDAGAFVPRIWAAVILFFRNRRYPLEKWAKIKTWLLIAQRFVNSSNATICQEGFLAWNKLTFAVMPDSSTSRHMFDMLKLPPTSRMNDRHSKEIRESALNSYYNLLHYGLRPGLSFEELDTAWDGYVEPELQVMLKSGSKGRRYACGILSGLFSARAGYWNANAANRPHPVSPESLPKLEARWVRSRFAKIVTLVDPLLRSVLITPGEINAAVSSLWHILMQNLAEAGSQEVKTSNELKEALAVLANELRALWSCCFDPSTGGPITERLDRYTALITTAVRGIGAGPFAEDILCKAENNSFQAATTPSHRASKHRGAPQSTFVFLFGLLYLAPCTLETAECMAPRLLSLHLSARSPASAQVELLAKSYQFWSASQYLDGEPEIAASLWSSVASAAAAILQKPSDDKANRGSQYLGLEMRNALILLKHGMKHVSARSGHEAAVELYGAMFSAAKLGSGIAGTVIAVVEPFAKAICDSISTLSELSMLRLTSTVILSASWPRTQQDLEQARKALWGVGTGSHRDANFDPFEHLYQLVLESLLHSYTCLETVSIEDRGCVLEYIVAVIAWLKACPRPLTVSALRKVQSGFARWIEDSARKTNDDTAVAEAMPAIWVQLLQILGTLPEKDATLLKALEPLLVAAFSSPHKAIVNDTIVFWNESFGCRESLSYPDKLRRVLSARKAETEIDLPGFPNSLNGPVTTLPLFFESQEVHSPRASPKMINITGPRNPATGHRTAEISRNTSTVGKAEGQFSPGASAFEIVERSSPKARLRHDDSQVEFAPIESSPIQHDDSQMLTERQREIKARQHENAQMFPELSSSPVTKSRSASRPISKQLDFTSECRPCLDDPPGTPQQDQDAELPMSDDIPSSPTPSSTRDAESVRLQMDDDESEPPSSPPGQSKADEYGAGTIQDEHEGNMTEDDGSGADDDVDEGLPRGVVQPADIDIQIMAVEAKGFALSDANTDLPSDTTLPAAQLQSEAEAAAKDATHGEQQDEATEGTTYIKAPAQEKPSSDFSSQPATADGLNAEDEVSRIESSFGQEAPAVEMEDLESNAESRQSKRSTRKRKRPALTSHASKRQKTQSPLKRFFSSFLGRSQQEQDEDIGEEIFVASSQASASPERAKADRTPLSRRKAPAAQAKLATTSQMATRESTASSGSHLQKRNVGRPKKIAASPPAIGEQSSSKKTLKRKASTISISSKAESGPATSFVKETPAPAKARKQREGPDTQLVKAARLPQGESEIGRSRRRRSPQVILPRERIDGAALEDEEDEVDVDDASEVDETKQASRPIATPRSILGRLRDVLADLPKMFLGSQEERDMDDVLFEIRKEVHGAGRRGRE